MNDNFRKYRHDDNIKFYNYISEKFADDEPFYILKISKFFFKYCIKSYK